MLNRCYDFGVNVNTAVSPNDIYEAPDTDDAFLPFLSFAFDEDVSSWDSYPQVKQCRTAAAHRKQIRKLLLTGSSTEYSFGSEIGANGLKFCVPDIKKLIDNVGREVMATYPNEDGRREMIPV